MEKENGEKLKGMLIKMPLSLHKMCRIQAIQKGLTLNKLMVRMIEKFFEEGKDI